MSERAGGVSRVAGDAAVREQTAAVADGLLGGSAGPDSRSTLAAVRDEGPIRLSELADRLAANDGTHDESNGDRHSRTSIALRHSHVPRLADKGLLEVDRDGEAVTVRPGREFDPEVVERVEALAAREHGEVLLSVLSEPDRRHVAAVLASADEAVPLSALVESLASRTADDEPDDATIDSARIALHHVHLPVLEGAGLVEYDSDERLVEPLDFPDPLSDLLSA